MPISFRLRLSGLVCVTLSTLLLHYAALGQDTVSSTEVGTIAGVLVDGESGETLIGAAVRIEGTLIGSATNLNGRYKIRVAAGTYQLEYSYIGYNTCLLYTSPSPRDRTRSRMPSSA